MRNETQGETRFVKNVKEAGGVAFKIRHRFMSGLPDTFVKLPRLPGVFLEFKFHTWPKVSASVPLKLSPLQRQFMQNAQRVEQHASWILFSTYEGRDVAFIGNGCNQKEVFVHHEENRFYRERGEPWSVRDIVWRLTRDSRWDTK